MKNCFKNAIMAVAAIAIVGFTSCNKGDGSATDEERNAILNVTLENPTLTRISGTAPGSGTTVTDYSIFVLDGDGNAIRKKYV